MISRFAGNPLLLVLVCLLISVGYSYRYSDLSYDALNEQLSPLKGRYGALATAKQVYSVPPATMGQHTCSPFILRVSDHSSMQMDASRPQVLISGEIHGDERVGPRTSVVLAQLLVWSAECMISGKTSSCKELDAMGGISLAQRTWLAFLATRRETIILPTANCLGYKLGVRGDGNVDPNRDFPYARRDRKCFRSTTARIFRALMQETIVQSVVTFHGGMVAMGYEWGSKNHLKPRDKSPDDNAHARIAQRMKAYAGSFAGGSFAGEGKAYPTGRINSLVYPVDGGMEDWLYAAGWDPGPLRQCDGIPGGSGISSSSGSDGGGGGGGSSSRNALRRRTLTAPTTVNTTTTGTSTSIDQSTSGTTTTSSSSSTATATATAYTECEKRKGRRQLPAVNTPKRRKSKSRLRHDAAAGGIGDSSVAAALEAARSSTSRSAAAGGAGGGAGAGGTNGSKKRGRYTTGGRAGRYAESSTTTTAVSAVPVKATEEAPGVAENRAVVYLVETSDRKRPADAALGGSEQILDSTAPQNGHIPRNVRLSLAAIDLVQPYVCINKVGVTAAAATAGKGVYVEWYVGGAVTVDRTFLSWHRIVPESTAAATATAATATKTEVRYGSRNSQRDDAGLVEPSGGGEGNGGDDATLQPPAQFLGNARSTSSSSGSSSRFGIGLLSSYIYPTSTTRSRSHTGRAGGNSAKDTGVSLLASPVLHGASRWSTTDDSSSSSRSSNIGAWNSTAARTVDEDTAASSKGTYMDLDPMRPKSVYAATAFTTTTTTTTDRTTVPQALAPGQYRLVAWAEVDQDFGISAPAGGAGAGAAGGTGQGYPRDRGPQSHLANLRTNINYSRRVGSRHVQGQRFWASDPIMVEVYESSAPAVKVKGTAAGDGRAATVNEQEQLQPQLEVRLLSHVQHCAWWNRQRHSSPSSSTTKSSTTSRSSKRRLDRSGATTTTTTTTTTSSSAPPSSTGQGRDATSSESGGGGAAGSSSIHSSRKYRRDNNASFHHDGRHHNNNLNPTSDQQHNSNISSTGSSSSSSRIRSSGRSGNHATININNGTASVTATTTTTTATTKNKSSGSGSTKGNGRYNEIHHNDSTGSSIRENSHAKAGKQNDHNAELSVGDTAHYNKYTRVNRTSSGITHLHLNSSRISGNSTSSSNGTFGAFAGDEAPPHILKNIFDTATYLPEGEMRGDALRIYAMTLCLLLVTVLSGCGVVIWQQWRHRSRVYDSITNNKYVNFPSFVQFRRQRGTGTGPVQHAMPTATSTTGAVATSTSISASTSQLSSWMGMGVDRIVDSAINTTTTTTSNNNTRSIGNSNSVHSSHGKPPSSSVTNSTATYAYLSSVDNRGY